MLTSVVDGSGIFLSMSCGFFQGQRSRSSCRWWSICVCPSVIGGIRRGGSLVEAGHGIQMRWGAKKEEEGRLSSSLLLLLFPSHLSTCPVCPKTRPASCRPQSSSSLDTLVAMSLKAKGAPHRRLNLTPLLWPSPLGS